MELNLAHSRLHHRLITILILALLLVAGGAAAFMLLRSHLAGPRRLAAFSESGVAVEIRLERDASGASLLAATFSPEGKGFHLYASDLPREGVGGLGRPTLLELPLQAKMQPDGPMQESVSAGPLEVVPGQAGLQVYPEGPVTLRLPVKLPAGCSGQVEDQVSVTYMACSSNGCRRPVIERLVDVEIPCAQR
ncbi:MAG: hypothetical protein EHM70_01705 [Chloroflexota bacterium]|nr:MAG: hypothetical protein EHM70_01705 [Chloroflexota bacterium]